MPLSTTAINTGSDAFVDLIDTGAGTGTLELGDSASFTTVLVTFDLDTPEAFAAAVGGIAAFNGTPISATATATGTATYQRLKNRDGIVVEGVDETIDAILALVNAGAGTATVEIGNSDFSAIYITYNLDTTAFGASSGGTATANGFPKSATASATGSGTHFRIKDRDGSVVDSQALPSPISFEAGQSYNFNSFSYTTTAYSQELASSTNITSGEDYTLNSGNYTQPAS
ncbi:hypothetical protein Lepto7375DRAFT_1840 [Leptolyngbya sp. PCC 7375]|nr:hypothetical protein Lepto7375DRAFT_1840 [Leptolyngbya sp. PCC 7375]